MQKGDTAAVFGLGTIGLAVIDALKEVGASKILAIDLDEGKFERAKKWGATECINPKKLDKGIVVRTSLDCCILNHVTLLIHEMIVLDLIMQ